MCGESLSVGSDPPAAWHLVGSLHQQSETKLLGFKQRETETQWRSDPVQLSEAYVAQLQGRVERWLQGWCQGRLTHTPEPIIETRLAVKDVAKESVVCVLQEQSSWTAARWKPNKDVLNCNTAAICSLSYVLCLDPPKVSQFSRQVKWKVAA